MKINLVKEEKTEEMEISANNESFRELQQRAEQMIDTKESFPKLYFYDQDQEKIFLESFTDFEYLIRSKSEKSRVIVEEQQKQESDKVMEEYYRIVNECPRWKLNLKKEKSEKIEEKILFLENLTSKMFGDLQKEIKRKNSHKNSNDIHRGLTCHLCKTINIRGKCYKCIECQQIQCQECQIESPHQHSQILLNKSVRSQVTKDMIDLVQIKTKSQPEKFDRLKIVKNLSKGCYDEQMYKDIVEKNSNLKIEEFILKMTKFFDQFKKQIMLPIRFQFQFLNQNHHSMGTFKGQLTNQPQHPEYSTSGCSRLVTFILTSSSPVVG